MIQKKSFSNAKIRRIPRSGGGFTCIRVLSYLLLGSGTLILMGAVVGFFVLLIKSAPTLFDVFRNPESMFSGFVLTLILVWLIVPMAFALFGVIFSGAGIILYFLATQPVSSDHIRDTSQEADSLTGDMNDKNDQHNNGRS